MDNLDYTVRYINRDEAKPLRYKVLWPHLPSEESCIIDIDLREDAFHLGTFDGDRLIAIGSFFQMNSPKLEARNPYRLRAMASDPQYRGKGGGRILIETALSILKNKQVDVLWCDARIVAVPFYQSLQFDSLEEVYDIPLIGPHRFMWKLV